MLEKVFEYMYTTSLPIVLVYKCLKKYVFIVKSDLCALAARCAVIWLFAIFVLLRSLFHLVAMKFTINDKPSIVKSFCINLSSKSETGGGGESISITSGLVKVITALSKKNPLASGIGPLNKDKQNKLKN